MSKILVVDDDVNIRKFCYDLFTSSGHKVITAENAEQLFFHVKTEKPDLVLLDIQIPGEEGLSLLRRMPNRKENRVPVVIFSGAVTAEFEKEAYEYGAIEVIRKGVGAAELRNKINKILDAKPRLFAEPAKKKEDKILVVDDDEKIRKLLTDFFQGKGFKTLAAKNGEDALSLVQSEKPSIILLDVTMPGMDGIMTLKEIRAIDPEVGVIMVTSLQDEHIAREAAELGSYHYVLKPFDLKYLELVVLTRITIAA